MIWEPKRETAWEKFYQAACEYYRRNGNLQVPSTYITAEGKHLGKWIRRQREAVGMSLREEQKEKLDAIQMVWNAQEKIDYRKCVRLQKGR